MKALPVLAAACCALALGACGNPPNEKAIEDFSPPVVARLETTSSPAPSESVVLADRILRRESGALLMEAGRQRTLAHEIGSMLSRLRDAYPATAEVTARQAHGFGTILVAFEPACSTPSPAFSTTRPDPSRCAPDTRSSTPSMPASACGA